jgi:hypothetical protein
MATKKQRELEKGIDSEKSIKFWENNKKCSIKFSFHFGKLFGVN